MSTKCLRDVSAIAIGRDRCDRARGRPLAGRPRNRRVGEGTTLAVLPRRADRAGATPRGYRVLLSEATTGLVSVPMRSIEHTDVSPGFM